MLNSYEVKEVGKEVEDYSIKGIVENTNEILTRTPESLFRILKNLRTFDPIEDDSSKKERMRKHQLWNSLLETFKIFYSEIKFKQ